MSQAWGQQIGQLNLHPYLSSPENLGCYSCKNTLAIWIFLPRHFCMPSEMTSTPCSFLWILTSTIISPLGWMRCSVSMVHICIYPLDETFQVSATKYTYIYCFCKIPCNPQDCDFCKFTRGADQLMADADDHAALPNHAWLSGTFHLQHKHAPQLILLSIDLITTCLSHSVHCQLHSLNALLFPRVTCPSFHIWFRNAGHHCWTP